MLETQREAEIAVIILERACSLTLCASQAPGRGSTGVMVVQLSRRAMLLYTILHSKPLYSAHFYVLCG